MTVDEQIADLQERITFQEDSLVKLSDYIAMQDKELRETRAQLKALTEKMRDMVDALEQVTPSQDNVRPPHY